MSVTLLRSILSRVMEHERRLAGMEWRGKVTDIQGSKIRIEIGTDEDGQPVKSPWVPVAQRAGALKLHSMPSIGEAVALRSESGDIRQASAHPHHWTDDNQAPLDDPNIHKMVFGGVEVFITDSAITAKVGGVTYEFTAAGLKQTGGDIFHDEVSIGKNHDHGEVFRGSDYSGPPRR